MSNQSLIWDRATKFLRRRLLFLIVAGYAIAGVWPAFGTALRHYKPINVDFGGFSFAPSMPTVMLGFLLFCSGMHVQIDRLGRTLLRPKVLVAGLAANVIIPLIYIIAIPFALRQWHNYDEVMTILMGLTLVASMPIAGSSTGWAQSVDGDMALSLGMVLMSTLLSPLTTPLSLHAVGLVSPGLIGKGFDELAGRGTGLFLLGWVLIPSLAGIAVRNLIGKGRLKAIEGPLNVGSVLTLLLLCYSNASACLPKVFAVPDWDFLAMTVVIALGLCLLTFSAGYVLAKLFRSDHDQKAALMFGLGMNNNGSGLVIASVMLSAQPLVLLPIIVYNLIQHIVAGGVQSRLRRTLPEAVA